MEFRGYRFTDEDHGQNDRGSATASAPSPRRKSRPVRRPVLGWVARLPNRRCFIDPVRQEVARLTCKAVSVATCFEKGVSARWPRDEPEGRERWEATNRILQSACWNSESRTLAVRRTLNEASGGCSVNPPRDFWWVIERELRTLLIYRLRDTSFPFEVRDAYFPRVRELACRSLERRRPTKSVFRDTVLLYRPISSGPG